MSELRQVLKEMASSEAQHHLYELGVKFSYRSAIQWANETLKNEDLLHLHDRQWRFGTPTMGAFLMGLAIGAAFIMAISR